MGFVEMKIMIKIGHMINDSNTSSKCDLLI